MIEEVIIGPLAQFGVLGLWTASLLWQRFYADKKRDEKFARLIENNTKAVTRVYEVIRGCHKRNI